MEYVYGRNVIASYLDSNDLLEVYYIKELKNSPLISELKQKKIALKETNKQELEKLVHTDKHQGIVGKIRDFKYQDYDLMVSNALTKPHPVLLMLDGIEDPHNLGAIIRSVEAFQIDGIILKKNNSVSINSTVAKVSTGALVNVNITQVTNLSSTLEDLKEKGFWSYAAEAYQGVSYNSVEYDRPTLLIVGSEGKGISRLLKEKADFRIYIPMYGKVNSLNVSVATAILLAKIKEK